MDGVRPGGGSRTNATIGDIVLMDNLPAHKRAKVRAALAEAGAQLLYLPPYSPDFNPIAMAFANSKP
jgi:transposase